MPAAAIEAFVLGFAQGRSLTHPYLAEKIGKVWAVRDAERRSGPYRREEYIAAGASPTEVDAVARATTRGNFAICHIVPAGEDDRPVRAGYKALDYHLRSTELVFAHRLTRIGRPDPAIGVERVTTDDMADRLAKASGMRMLTGDDFSFDAPMRAYVVQREGVPVAWVRSGRVGPSTYCSWLNTEPAFRRQGLGRNLLLTMLRDDRAAGTTTAVLTASHAGALLYPTVGYDRLGTLLLFKSSKQET